MFLTDILTDSLHVRELQPVDAARLGGHGVRLAQPRLGLSTVCNVVEVWGWTR